MNGRIAAIATLVLACGGCASTNPLPSRLPSVVGSDRAKSAAPSRTGHKPDQRATADCALLSFDIGVSGDGGVLLTYVAIPGLEERLRSDVRDRVRRHNARATSAVPGSPRTDEALSTVALPAPTKDGIRVTLLPSAENDTPELFANTELFAPELVPSDRDLSCAESTPRLAWVQVKISTEI